MDGARGGGRGKGKKAKAAKKKAAAAALAAGHKKPAGAAHGGKKVGASHASAQVVTLSKAPAAAPAEAANPATPHDQPMTKSKRKRLKKQAAGVANSLLKKQAAAEAEKQAKATLTHAQQAKKSPTAANAAPPKAKPVAVLAPVAAPVKSHVVSLTGGKKKKRKRNAALNAADNATEKAATTVVTSVTNSPKSGQTEGPMMKKVAVVAHSVSSPSQKTATIISTSPKRKIAQVGATKKTQVQHEQKSKGVATPTTASPKNVTVSSSPKTVKKMKLKSTTAGTAKPAVALASTPATTSLKGDEQKSKSACTLLITSSRNEPVTSSPKPIKKVKVTPAIAVAVQPAATAASTGATVPFKVHTPPKTEQAKTETQSEQKAIVAANISQPATLLNTTKPKTLAQKAKASQVDGSDKTIALQQQPHTSKLQEDKSVAPSSAEPPKSEVQSTKSLKAAKKIETPVSVAASAATTPKEKAASLESKPSSAAVPVAVSLKTSHTAASPAASVASSAAKKALPHSAPHPRAAGASATAVSSPATSKAAPVVQAKAGSLQTLQSSGLKRRRSIELVSITTGNVHPPLKRSAVATENTPMESKMVQQTSSSVTQADDDRRKGTQGHGSKSQSQTTVSTLNQQDPANSQARGNDTKLIKTVAVKQSPGKKPLKPTSERKTVKMSTEVSSAKQSTADRPTNAAKGAPKKAGTAVQDPTAASSSENTSKTSKVGIIMDSHAYVQKMLLGELEASGSSIKRDTHSTASTDMGTVLPPRPQNAWGASFGLAPPAQATLSSSRTLSTTPLSSWFLSKGCANFVKRVHFSDDEDDSSSSEGDDIDARPSGSISLHGADKASPKRRASVAKKNAFLESLTTQSNWRTWYGKVDLHNLLDPPLTHIPEKLRAHEVTPLPLPEPTAESVTSTATKKAHDIDMLEADIRHSVQQAVAGDAPGQDGVGQAARGGVQTAAAAINASCLL
ncbi:unnamed protein product [Phytophthora lilii]|uniref:Unnamed protein product n=1 Tax=Phytophthora lilii TaxID=2077276 RepID=A0A9W6X3R6_9STRA|nr:unnamed protein product [Phytophthora lilii]